MNSKKTGWCKKEITMDSIFIMQNFKLTCLICWETVTAFKELNVKRHLEKFDAEVRKNMLINFKAKLKAQQSLFSSLLKQSSNETIFSWEIIKILYSSHCKMLCLSNMSNAIDHLKNSNWRYTSTNTFKHFYCR